MIVNISPRPTGLNDRQHFTFTVEMRRIHDWPFFYRLKGEKSLIGQRPRSEFHGKIIVSLQYSSPKGIQRLFAAFPTPGSLLDFMAKFEPLQRCFYEVILGEFPQKVYFDFDKIKSKEEELDFLQHLLSSIEEVLAGLGYDFDLGRDLVLYSSHGPGKFSLHVVLKGYAVYNSKDNAEFCLRIRDRLPTKYREIFDDSMYSSVQQFRTLYSTKCQQDRPKKLEPLIFYKGKAYKIGSTKEGRERLLENFIHSLVGNIDGTIFLPSLYQEPVKKAITESIDQERARQAYDLFLEQQSLVTTYRETWVSPKEIKGGIIVLRRLCPTQCQICRRVHESENPYLVVNGQSVFYSCRRQSRALFLGELNGGVEGELDILTKYCSPGRVVIPPPSPVPSPAPPATIPSPVPPAAIPSPAPAPQPRYQLQIPEPDFLSIIDKLPFLERLPPVKKINQTKEDLWAGVEEIPVEESPRPDPELPDLGEIPSGMPIKERHLDHWEESKGGSKEESKGGGKGVEYPCRYLNKYLSKKEERRQRVWDGL